MVGFLIRLTLDVLQDLDHDGIFQYPNIGKFLRMEILEVKDRGGSVILLERLCKVVQGKWRYVQQANIILLTDFAILLEVVIRQVKVLKPPDKDVITVCWVLTPVDRDALYLLLKRELSPLILLVQIELSRVRGYDVNVMALLRKSFGEIEIDVGSAPDLRYEVSNDQQYSHRRT